MKYNQNIQVSLKNIALKTPDSPKTNTKKTEKSYHDPDKESKNNSLVQDSKIKQSIREDSPANKNNIKQMSFTKFPPLKKNDDPESQLNIFEKTYGRKYSEKQNQIQQNLFLKQRQNIRKKVQKKKVIIINSINPNLLSKYRQYKQFLDTINLTNNIKIMNQKKQFTPYIAYVGKGNNSLLVTNTLKNRPWWIITEDPQQKQINFVWTQLRQNYILKDFKSIKNQIQFDDLNYQVQDQKINQIVGSQQSEGQMKFNSNNKNKIFSRSQSVNKQSVIIKSVKNVKRNTPKSKQRQSFSHKSIALPNNTKQIKQIVQSQKQKNKKDILANPKTWTHFQNYRKIFSQKDMKSLKALSAIQEDGTLKFLKRNKMRIIQNLNGRKSHNHLQNNWHLSNKKALFYNVKCYYEAKKINPFDYIPVTFHVQDMKSKQYTKFLEYYNQKNQQIIQEQKKPQNQLKNRNKKRNIWLVKPGQNTNRGTGIIVTQTIQQINQIIQKDKFDELGRPRTHIIQQYIMPFLYNKRKFDIRTYICITSVNGFSKGYWFQEGYIRTACKQFNLKNLTNKMIHLTNDAVQKKCQDYGKYQPGNKLSFSDFQRYLDGQQNKFKFWTTAYPDMKKLATDSIKAVYTKIDPQKKQFSFQIFGLDFMIDQNFKVWLIQANTNPCLQLSSPLLGRIIPSMVQNAFKIALDTIFPPPHQSLLGSMKKPYIPDNLYDSNKFDLVFDEIEEGKQLKNLLTNVPNVQIFNIEQQQQDEFEQKNQKMQQRSYNELHPE